MNRYFFAIFRDVKITKEIEVSNDLRQTVIAVSGEMKPIVIEFRIGNLYVNIVPSANLAYDI